MLAFGLMLGLVSLNARDRALAHVQLVQGTKPSPVPPAPDPDLNPFLVPPTDKLFGEPKSKDDFFRNPLFSIPKRKAHPLPPPIDCDSFGEPCGRRVMWFI